MIALALGIGCSWNETLEDAERVGTFATEALDTIITEDGDTIITET